MKLKGECFMEAEWLEIAYINFDKVIMHGESENGIVEQELNEEQKYLVFDMNMRHSREMHELLRTFLL
jgi:hypothetical protein